ncbi:MAG: hypothetical protein HY770_01715 [Chitinivibrionia bacterium]|nr:hypothetical protein [Chitinivibrionia bacterium]
MLLEAPVPPELHLNNAREAAGKGQWPVAEFGYQNVLVGEPSHIEAIVELAGVYEAMGRYDYARGLLQRALALDDRNETLIERNIAVTRKLARSLHAEIDSLVAVGACDLAIPKLSLLLTLEPENPSLHYQKALCHYHAGRFDSALPSIETALGLCREMPYYDLRRMILERRHLQTRPAARQSWPLMRRAPWRGTSSCSSPPRSSSSCSVPP